MDTQNQSLNNTDSERLLTIAQKLLAQNNLTEAKDFALLAKEHDPLLDGSDQIIAITDVLLVAEKNSEKLDYYAVLGLEKGENDKDAIRKGYRKYALMLHPDKNGLLLAESAFKYVSQAWAVLSDTTKKAAYDWANGLAQTGAVYTREARQKLPVRRPVKEKAVDSFWTACPYCYHLYQYLRVYEDCCLRCPTCQRAFTAVTIPTLPVFVPGREAYYCTGNLFPLQSDVSMGKPQSDPRATHDGGVGATGSSGGVGGSGFVNGAVPSSSSGRKRGRPRKHLTQ